MAFGPRCGSMGIIPRNAAFSNDPNQWMISGYNEEGILGSPLKPQGRGTETLRILGFVKCILGRRRSPFRQSASGILG